MGKLRLNVYPRVDRRELPFYKRLSDALGLLSIYPILSVLAIGLGGSLVFFVSESYLILVSSFLALLAVTKRGLREAVLGAMVVAGVVLVVSPYVLLLMFGVEEAFWGVAGKLTIFVASGLLVHEVSRKLNMREKLDKYGGLVVLGSLALLVRLPVFVLGGLIILALGLGGASSELRKLYYANMAGG